FNATPLSSIYTLSLHDALPISIRSVVRKLMAVPFEGFVLALPHAEAVVGLRAPIFQVAYDNFVGWAVTLHAFKDDFTFAVVHLRSEEHTSELQSRRDLVCRLLL